MKVEKGEVYVAAVARSGGQTLDWNIGSGWTDKKDQWVHIENKAVVPDRCDRIYVRFGGREETRVRVDDVTLTLMNAVPVDKPASAKVDGYAGKRVTEAHDRGWSRCRRGVTRFTCRGGCGRTTRRPPRVHK